MRKASIFLIITVLTVSLIGCSQRIEEAGNDESSMPSSSFSAGETEESPVPSEEPMATSDPATTPPAESEQSTSTPATSATASQEQASSQTKQPQSTPGSSNPATPTPENSQRQHRRPTAEPITEPPKEKTIYDYEFDITAIKNELIAIGQGMGLTHITTDDGITITPDNSSWAQPVTASKDFQGESLKRALKDYVTSMPGIVKSYGGNAIQYFTIYTKPLGNGSYTFYFLY